MESINTCEPTYQDFSTDSCVLLCYLRITVTLAAQCTVQHPASVNVSTRAYTVTFYTVHTFLDYLLPTDIFSTVW